MIVFKNEKSVTNLKINIEDISGFRTNLGVYILTTEGYHMLFFSQHVCDSIKAFELDEIDTVEEFARQFFLKPTEKVLKIYEDENDFTLTFDD
jgi:hypothetical protein